MRNYYLLVVFNFIFALHTALPQGAYSLQQQSDSLQKLDTALAVTIQLLEAQRTAIAQQLQLLQQHPVTSTSKAPYEEKATVVGGSGGMMRQEPALSSETITFIPAGSLVVVRHFYQNTYFRIAYDGITGYLSESSLPLTDELRAIRSYWLEKQAQEKALTQPAVSYQPEKKQDAYTSRKYITGSRGGCYYINGSGNKTYVDRSFCGGSNNPVKTYSGRTYYKGPRGGCYYISGGGNKVYVSRSMCN